MLSRKPTVSRLRELLGFNAEGNLVWLSPRKGKKLTGVGCRRPDGYVRVRIDYGSYYAHHIIWALAHGEWPALPIDHVNRDRSDNRLENLRVATPSQNQANRAKTRRNTTGFKGVSRRPSGRYLATIEHGGLSTCLGTYDDPFAAAEAYKVAATRLHGEFARVA